MLRYCAPPDCLRISLYHGRRTAGAHGRKHGLMARTARSHAALRRHPNGTVAVAMPAAIWRTINPQNTQLAADDCRAGSQWPQRRIARPERWASPRRIIVAPRSPRPFRWSWLHPCPRALLSQSGDAPCPPRLPEEMFKRSGRAISRMNKPPGGRSDPHHNKTIVARSASWKGFFADGHDAAASRLHCRRGGALAWWLSSGGCPAVTLNVARKNKLGPVQATSHLRKHRIV
jgi:hypothetical protein